MKRLLSALAVGGLLLGACTSLNSEVSSSGNPVAPSVSSRARIAFDDCSGLKVPRDQEVNTYLDRANHLLEFSYLEAATATDRTYRIDYTDKTCRTNPDTSRLIRHVLGTENQALNPSRTFVVADCFAGTMQPSRMTLACADNGFRARQLSWSRWGRKQALGRGVFVINDCEPSCIVGNFQQREGRIVLKERRFCKELNKYVFMSGKVIYDEPFQERFKDSIYPGCPADS